MQTVVVEGPFGSGKTSAIRLLERLNISDPDTIILVIVSTWGISSSAVRQYTLNRAIEELGKRVDCRALRGMPQAYVDAFSQSSKWLSVLLAPWVSEKEPVEQLRLMTPILRAIDAQLVIVIEDSDRKAPDFDPAHLHAMLNDFRRVERLSFVLTVGNAAEVDFAKLAEQIIFIPRVPVSDAAFFLDKIRDHCREKWPAIDILAGTGSRPVSLVADLQAAQLAGSIFGRQSLIWT